MKVMGAVAAFAMLPVMPAAGQPSLAEQGTILSAFYGLDDSRRIRFRAAWACRGLTAGDGMPVIFSHEVDPGSVDPEDFRVVRASGETGRVQCVTLRPADEPGEFRTALVIGQYGSAEDPPVRVEIVGDVHARDGDLNFIGATADVIDLAAGPTLILAEIVSPDDWNVGGPGDCPAEGLRGIVRATWTGGVTRPGGDEVGAQEAQLYRVMLRQDDGSEIAVAPTAIGDLDDNDNNHELCLDVSGTPLAVSFPAGVLTDPNDDLNPDTRIHVSDPLSR